jgi:acetate kinase
MTTRHVTRLVTINTGSSSLRTALYHLDDIERLDLAAEVEQIGLSDGRMCVLDADGKTLLDQQGDLQDHRVALQALLSWLKQHQYLQELNAVGHRVVHGGSAYSEPQLITAEVLIRLQHLIPIDPDHLPQALDAIHAVSHAFPALPQVACFDTAFHRHMPRMAQAYALPKRIQDMGVARYGFHGLSYEYVMDRLRVLEPETAAGRVIIAHLGNGASMAAVREGEGVDTTMGFTPTGGLIMSTRSGDLDPGVLLYLLQSRGMSPTEVNRLVNKQAGLLGVSGISADMRDLLARESADRRTADAIALFCYQARKFLGALAAVLGGLDMLVFTGGIGEHAAPIRERICTELEFLGIQLDPERNTEHAPIVSRDGSPVTIRVMKTDEDLMIARHTYRLISQQAGASRV